MKAKDDYATTQIIANDDHSSSLVLYMNEFVMLHAEYCNDVENLLVFPAKNGMAENLRNTWGVLITKVRGERGIVVDSTMSDRMWAAKNDDKTSARGALDSWLVDEFGGHRCKLASCPPELVAEAATAIRELDESTEMRTFRNGEQKATGCYQYFLGWSTGRSRSGVRSTFIVQSVTRTFAATGVHKSSLMETLREAVHSLSSVELMCDVKVHVNPEPYRLHGSDVAEAKLGKLGIINWLEQQYEGSEKPAAPLNYLVAHATSLTITITRRPEDEVIKEVELEALTNAILKEGDEGDEGGGGDAGETSSLREARLANRKRRRLEP